LRSAACSCGNSHESGDHFDGYVPSVEPCRRLVMLLVLDVLVL